MRKSRHLAAAIATSAACFSSASDAGDALFRLGYDDGRSSLVEAVAGMPVKVEGGFTLIKSPIGTAMRLDGDTTKISAAPISQLTDGSSWSASAWIRLDALPWNEAPILDQALASGSVVFAVDAYGHLVAQRRAGAGQSVRIVSNDAVAPRAWTLVTLSYDEGALRLWMNGRPVPAARSEAPPQAEKASATPLLIGRTRAPTLPFPSHAIHPQLPVDSSLEGSIARLTVLDEPMTAKLARRLMTEVDPAERRQAPGPRLPRWRGGPGPFGAFHTSLPYDPAWDAPRRVADGDVVVRFANSPVQLVFWQGANYIPAWVTENGRWYSDQFMEIYGKPRCPDGEDCEPMSDKQVRYSHVEILESTPARAVVHWRYALSEVENDRLADAADPRSWGAWADEYWTVYPDAVAVRKQVLWTDHPEREASEFQESIVMIPAGESPEDNINLDALTLANLRGETRTYRWLARDATGFAKPRGPDHFTGLDDPMIQWINLKSQWKPFEIAGAGPAKFEGINWEPSMSSFEWWNHWPVAQIRSSGRPALTSDRPSHSSLSHIYWPIAHKDEKRLVRLLMTGLTLQKADGLVPRAQSWLTPPGASLSGGGSVRFDQAERAYVVEPTDPSRPIRIEIAATKTSPLVDPAFIVEGWQGAAAVSVEGEGIGTTKPEIGYVETLRGRRLVVYAPLNAGAATVVSISPVQ
ncbi:LamG domain-containing protein [Sphingomonas sp. Tas61C01]|uniref:LamG domain-containing protein n=1 Tax=Sphingomonas sp. Tas61C01 TaxID=3458297 RepID=UPI00403EA49E